MSTPVLLKRKEGFAATVGETLFVISILIVFVSITGCSSSSNVELPKDFIREFIAKHETMVDKSLVYYYAREEQSTVAEKIDLACRVNKTKGILESLEKPTFDFSGLKIEIVDQKEEYFDDEPVLYVKVAVRGNYTMELPEENKKIDTDEVIILKMARHEWKVTETNNPWS